METGYFDRMAGTISAQVKTKTSSSSPSGSSFLDVDTVMKASQAISGEIELGALLSKMIAILAENAGAQKGVLVLEEEGRLFVEALVQAGNTNVMQHAPLESFNDAPEAIVRYVVKTGETLVLDDASASGSFMNEPYVKEGKTKSVLCLPVVKQKKLVGVLYLENNLAASAFTPERVEMLNVLSAQAAINIENAKLYGKLEDYSKNLEIKVEERTAELAEKNAAMLNELRLARRVQERLVPNDEELAKVQRCSVVGRYIAMEELGGDIYDVIHIDEDKVRAFDRRRLGTRSLGQPGDGHGQGEL